MSSKHCVAIDNCRIWTDFIIIWKHHHWDNGKHSERQKVSLTSCSGSAGGSEKWALGPDRRERPTGECDLSGPTTETRADGPEESPRHTWRQRDRETELCDAWRQRVKRQRREVSVLFLASNKSVTRSKASSVGAPRQTALCPNPHTAVTTSTDWSFTQSFTDREAGHSELSANGRSPYLVCLLQFCPTRQ